MNTKKENIKDAWVSIRMTAAQKNKLERQAFEAGYFSASEYLRALIETHQTVLEVKKNHEKVEKIATELAGLIRDDIQQIAKQSTVSAVKEIFQKVNRHG